MNLNQQESWNEGDIFANGIHDWPEEELRSHLEAQAQFNLDVLKYVPAVPSPTPWREMRIYASIVFFSTRIGGIFYMSTVDANAALAIQVNDINYERFIL